MHCRTASEIHRAKKGRSMGKGPRVLIISSLPFLYFSVCKDFGALCRATAYSTSKISLSGSLSGSLSRCL